MPAVGIFAQRAKHRPNPIGITAVELLQVERNVVKVKGLDPGGGAAVFTRNQRDFERIRELRDFQLRVYETPERQA